MVYITICMVYITICTVYINLHIQQGKNNTKSKLTYLHRFHVVHNTNLIVGNFLDLGELKVDLESLGVFVVGDHHFLLCLFIAGLVHNHCVLAGHQQAPIVAVMSCAEQGRRSNITLHLHLC